LRWIQSIAYRIRRRISTELTSKPTLKEHLVASALLGAIIILVYGDIVFMGYTLSPALSNLNVLIPPYGYQGRWPLFLTVIDPLASGGQNWPVNVLIAKLFRSGQLPLWNPYQGTGAPLAADTTWSAYFPIDMLYALVPNQYWDYLWLLKLWTAGILAYLLLRRIGLSFLSAIGGGLAYCLSGAFSWYPFLPWTNVAILTPALLLVSIMCFQEPFRTSSVVTGSMAFAVTLLGAHLESLIIQFAYLLLFVMFEAATRRGQRKFAGLATWAISLVLGIGLAAFFVLPVQEYIREAALGHGPDVGIMSVATAGNRTIWWVGLFAPYLYGFLQTYFYAGLRSVFFWDISPGYIGICVPFLSLLPLYPIVRRSAKIANPKYYLFFLAMTVLILMKIFGLPPINLIGLMPGFQYVVFSRYSGSVLTLSFAATAAYGLEFTWKRQVGKISGTVLVLVLGAILPAVLATMPNPLSPSGQFFHISLAYLALGIYYAAMSAYVACKGGGTAVKTLVALLVLELVSYVPRGLTVQYEAARVCVLAGAGLILIIRTSFEGPQDTTDKRPHIKRTLAGAAKETDFPQLFVNRLTARNITAVVMIIALILQFALAGASPNGIPNRYDPYTPPPYVEFLRENLGYQRVYSPDGIFFPPAAGVYSLQNLGEFSSLMPFSFQAFSVTNLDNESSFTGFVGNAWGPPRAISAETEIRNNIAFYSLLGVKYFVTANGELGTINKTSIQSVNQNDFGWAPVGNNTVSFSFATDVPFDALSLRIGTYDRTNSGDVLVKIDSIPYNESLHRQSSIDARLIINGVPNTFSFSLLPITRRTLFTLSISQSETRNGNEVAILRWSHVQPNPHLSLLTGSLNMSLSLEFEDPSMPLVYHDVNATIYENLKVFPRTFLAWSVMGARDEHDAVLKTRELEWEARQTVVGEAICPSEISTINSGVGDSGNASIQEYAANRVLIHTFVLRPALLVLTDTYFPGWSAYVDGKSVPIYRVYGVARGIFLAPGSHQVMFRYEPTSFRIGFAISITSATLVALLLCSAVLRRRHRKAAID
jgi:hypothetical protein